MTRDKAFLRFCNFTLTHCFEGTTCPKWSHDYVTDYCGDKDMMVAKYKCDRFEEEEAARHRERARLCKAKVPAEKATSEEE
jgi:hypothetical protein